MGTVISIFKKGLIEKKFEENEIIKAEELVKINGRDDKAITKAVYKRSINVNNEKNYEIFNLEHYQKYKIEGQVNNEAINEILRKEKMYLYIESSTINTDEIMVILGNQKHSYAHKAMQRLTENTSIHGEIINLDLKNIVKKIKKQNDDISIKDSWFSNIQDSHLRNVSYSGIDIEQNADWKKYEKDPMTELSNIGLVFDDISGESLTISLSKNAVLFTRKNIREDRMITVIDIIKEIIK